MIGLNFEITEPEGNHRLDYMEVRLTEKVTMSSLLGLRIMLDSLLGKVFFYSRPKFKYNEIMLTE